MIIHDNTVRETKYADDDVNTRPKYFFFFEFLPKKAVFQLIIFPRYWFFGRTKKLFNDKKNLWNFFFKAKDRQKNASRCSV